MYVCSISWITAPTHILASTNGGRGGLLPGMGQPQLRVVIVRARVEVLDRRIAVVLVTYEVAQKVERIHVATFSNLRIV
eukprot:COSAG01_NODE_3834_length_5650_cov_4.421005_3_plen_79_part_00